VGCPLLVEARPSGGKRTLEVPRAAFVNEGGIVDLHLPTTVTNLDLRVVYEPVRTLEIPLPPPDAKP
jgi:hypothetical protein